MSFFSAATCCCRSAITTCAVWPNGTATESTAPTAQLHGSDVGAAANQIGTRVARRTVERGPSLNTTIVVIILRASNRPDEAMPCNMLHFSTSKPTQNPHHATSHKMASPLESPGRGTATASSCLLAESSTGEKPLGRWNSSLPSSPRSRRPLQLTPTPPQTPGRRSLFSWYGPRWGWDLRLPLAETFSVVWPERRRRSRSRCACTLSVPYKRRDVTKAAYSCSDFPCRRRCASLSFVRGLGG